MVDTARDRAFDWPEALKEALLVAFVMVALTVLMVGIEVRDIPGGLDLIGRFGDVAFAALFGLIGRIAVVALRQGWPRPVFWTSLPLGVCLFLILMSQTLIGLLAGIGLDLGQDFAKGMQALKVALPFKSLVVMWIVLIVVVVFTIWSLREMIAPDRPTAAAQDAATASSETPLVQKSSAIWAPS